MDIYTISIFGNKIFFEIIKEIKLFSKFKAKYYEDVDTCIKNAKKEYQKTCLPFSDPFSKINNGIKAIKTKGNIPIDGQENASNNPLNKANNSLFIPFTNIIIFLLK